VTELIAYHEAGHGVVAYLLGGVVRQITIEPDADDGPRRGGDTQVVWRRGNDSDKLFAQKSVQVHLAGPVAEIIYSGEFYHPAFVAEWAADWEGAAEAAALLHADLPRRLQYLEQTSRQLHRRLQSDAIWMALAALADSLLAHETLDQEQVEEVLEELLG
jgi:ATP-dependent Zn protease